MITWECVVHNVILLPFRIVVLCRPQLLLKTGHPWGLGEFHRWEFHGVPEEKKARILTARMNRAGIHSLEELKSRLDAHGEAKQRSLGKITKEGLTVEDVLTFLDSWMCLDVRAGICLVMAMLGVTVGCFGHLGTAVDDLEMMTWRWGMRRFRYAQLWIELSRA